ncbi:Flp pilus assembly protein TadD, contains TPR repeat [Liberibacter crescens BT-1]|uniref:Flp pilus assembly protein TadD, contains TPR repeat n=1 Tax=Liberibacter crescens (strain BT-1) TaxID=1215343 RepID=L0EUB3_LIBCB|nr:Flp pilus assembly protein TadD, contains TPR repeat [Liberibacter crescens BT-1]
MFFLKSFITKNVYRLTIVFLITGCANNTTRYPTSLSSQSLEKMNHTQLLQLAETIGRNYDRNRKNKDIGINYANILRMIGRDAQALAVMQQVAILHPQDRSVLAAYGKAQADAGQLEEAITTIDRAQTPDRPNWELMSAKGSILDQMGKHDEARKNYLDALEIAPNEPSILSNMAMSYLLTGNIKIAEEKLRAAASMPGADSRVRQNLAFVLGLQGRIDEAYKIARQELSPEDAEHNVNYLRSMLSQQKSWDKIKERDSRNVFKR